MTKAETSAIKKSVFSSLLEKDVVLILIPHPHPGVVLPQHLKFPLFLEYGLDMPTPIRDLVVNDRGVSAILSFDFIPTNTFVPWEAIGTLNVRSNVFQAHCLQTMMPWLFGEFPPGFKCKCGRAFSMHSHSSETQSWVCSDLSCECKEFSPECTCGSSMHNVYCAVVGWEEFRRTWNPTEAKTEVKVEAVQSKPKLKLVP